MPTSSGSAPVVICGAGASGLASAAMLRAHGIESLVLERADRIAPSWRSRYDGLRLNTLGWMSRQTWMASIPTQGNWSTPGSSETRLPTKVATFS